MKTVNILGVQWKLFGMSDHHRIALASAKEEMDGPKKKYMYYKDRYYIEARERLWSYAMDHIAKIITDGNGLVFMEDPRLKVMDELHALYKRNICRDNISYKNIVHCIRSVLAKFREEAGYYKKPMNLFLPCMKSNHPEMAPEPVERTFLILRSYVVNYVLGYYPAWPFICDTMNNSESYSASRWHGSNQNGYYHVYNSKSSVFEANSEAMVEIFGKLKKKTTKVNGQSEQAFTKNARDVLDRNIPSDLVAKAYRLMDSYMAHIMARVMMGCIRESRRKDISEEALINCNLGFDKGDPNFIDRFQTKWTNHYDSYYNYPHTNIHSGGVEISKRDTEWNKWYRKHRWVLAAPSMLPTVTRPMVASRTEDNFISDHSPTHQRCINAMSVGYYWFKGIDAGVKYEKLMDQLYTKKVDVATGDKVGASAYIPNRYDDIRCLSNDLDAGLYCNDLDSIDTLMRHIGTPAYEDRSTFTSNPSELRIFDSKISASFFPRVFSRGLTWSGGLTTHVYSKPRELGHDMIVYEGVRMDHGGDMNRLRSTPFQKFVDEKQLSNLRQNQRVFVKHRPTGITVAVKCDTLKLVSKNRVKDSNGDYVTRLTNLPDYDDVCQHKVSDQFIEAFLQYLSSMESIDSMRIFSSNGRKLHDLMQEDTEIGNSSFMRKRYAYLSKDEYDPSIATEARAVVKRFYMQSGQAIDTAHDCRILANHIIAPTAMNYTINNYNSFFIPCHRNLYLSRTGLKANVRCDNEMMDGTAVTCTTYRLIVADNHGSAVTEHAIPPRGWPSGVTNLQAMEDLRMMGIAFVSDVNFPTIIRSKSIFNK